MSLYGRGILSRAFLVAPRLLQVDCEHLAHDTSHRDHGSPSCPNPRLLRFQGDGNARVPAGKR